MDIGTYHNFNLSETPYGRTKNWNVRQSTISSISKSADMRGYVLALRTESKKTVQPKKSDHLLSTEGELLANTLWRFLQLRDFVSSDHTLSPWGVALSVGLEMLSNHPDMYDPLYLGLELFRLQSLNPEEFSVRYPEGQKHGTGNTDSLLRLSLDEERGHIRLLCRVACLTTLKKSTTTWKGPVSKSLLAYNSMVTEVQRNVRNLIEMVVLSMCAHGDVDRLHKRPHEWTSIGMQYRPF